MCKLNMIIKSLQYCCILLSFLFFVSCLGVDNYSAPNAKIEGHLIDVETNEFILTEQPDGCRIKLDDLSYKNPVSLYFWAKANGEFKNTALFSGEYSVAPVDGPFFPITPITINLGKKTKQDFYVTPFLKVELKSIEKGGMGTGIAKVVFTCKRSTTPQNIELESKTIAEVFILCNTVSVVSYGNSGYINKHLVKKIFSRTRDEVIEKTVYEVEIPNLRSGIKYYVRIAGRSSTSYNPLKRYNYSGTVEFVAP